MRHPVKVVVVSAIITAAIAAGCQTSGSTATAGGASRGERFFKTKCNSCHPNGGQGAGPPIDAGLAPDFLERGKSSGRHAVPEGDWEPLIAYINQSFGGGVAVAEVTPAPAPAPAPGVPVPPPAPAPAPAPPPAPAGDTAAGASYFQTKCAKCHPGGAKVTGKAVPGVLQAGGSGKHGVDAAQFEGLISYLVASFGAVRAGGAPATGGPATTGAVVASSGGGDAGLGASYYGAKCAKCHPGGAKITGRTIPGPLVAGGSGKHGIEGAQFENVMAYLVTLGAVRAGGGPTTAGHTGGTTTPATTTSDGTIPINAGMVNCTCNAQCPPGLPAEAQQAACLIVTCTCPR